MSIIQLSQLCTCEYGDCVMQVICVIDFIVA